MKAKYQQMLGALSAALFELDRLAIDPVEVLSVEAFGYSDELKVQLSASAFAQAFPSVPWRYSSEAKREYDNIEVGSVRFVACRSALPNTGTEG